MALTYREDSIKKIREDESQYSKDRIKIIPVDQEPPEVDPDDAKNDIFMDVKPIDDEGDETCIQFIDVDGNKYDTFRNAAHLGGKDPSYYAPQSAIPTSPEDIGAAKSEQGVHLYTHSKSGTTHNFTGTGKNGIAKITAAFDSGDSVQLNGVPVTATCGADPVDGDTIVNGRWVSFVADAEGGQINFKGGGGLGNTKLAQATAEPGMVSEDATFYAGDKTLKTGTLVERGTAQYAGAVNPSGSGTSAYIAFAEIPEGIYRANGTSWGPEIRALRGDVISKILSVTKHTAQEVQGDDKTTTKTAAVSKDQVWMFVTFVGSGGGATSSLSTPNATTYVDIYENVTRQENDPMRLLRIRVCKFNAAGTVTATLHTGQGWASTYFAFIKLA